MPTETASEKTKRIAKNTILLYLRMLFSMLVALYTSRVILNALGESDYGIYGSVGGIVTMFSVISGSLNAAISRFITFELGRGDKDRLSRVFCTSINIQTIISIIFVVLAEIIGVWFLNVKMNIPEGRMYAANWVLQFSIVAFVVSLQTVPYNAAIIAHERMGAFAYISILSTILNLIVAILIVYSPIDRLIYYAFAVLAINVLMQCIYIFYCKRHFEETHWHFIIDKSLLKEMFTFSGWNFLGASSGVLLGQGVNLLMNIFFGVTVNAARSIASSVDNAINILVNNFTMALNPQITKSYANKELDYMHDLVCKGAKYSYFIMFIVALPILLETPQILVLWLKQVPDFTIIFTRLTILISLTYVLSQTLITSMLANGDIKKYQIIISSLSFSIFILAYVLFKLGYPPYVSYIVQLIIFIVQLFVRIYLLRDMISIPVQMFIKEVLLKIILISLISAIIPCIILFQMDETISRLFIVVATSLICTITSIYFLGLSQNEKTWIKRLVKQKIGNK